MSRQRSIFPSLILPRNQSIHYLLILNPAKFTVEQVGANVISEAGG
ncbi:unnamed protein product [Musa acuminata var. zebrina]